MMMKMIIFPWSVTSDLSDYIFRHDYFCWLKLNQSEQFFLHPWIWSVSFFLLFGARIEMKKKPWNTYGFWGLCHMRASIPCLDPCTCTLSYLHLSACTGAFEWIIVGIEASLRPRGMKHWMEVSAVGWIKLEEKWWVHLLCCVVQIGRWGGGFASGGLAHVSPSPVYRGPVSGARYWFLPGWDGIALEDSVTDGLRRNAGISGGVYLLSRYRGGLNCLSLLTFPWPPFIGSCYRKKHTVNFKSKAFPQLGRPFKRKYTFCKATSTRLIFFLLFGTTTKGIDQSHCAEQIYYTVVQQHGGY